jgi:hypothetical protein
LDNLHSFTRPVGSGIGLPCCIQQSAIGDCCDRFDYQVDPGPCARQVTGLNKLRKFGLLLQKGPGRSVSVSLACGTAL